MFGPVMIPNKLIFRKPNDVIKYEHYTTFSEDNIKKTAEMFFQNNTKFNFNHVKNDSVEATIIQSYLLKSDDEIK